ncbi:MAG: WXG100 family type VII secretion target [Mycolicibacterium cosmeticum]|nr:WXG100 family type VII secretion target [Mycolicibacterium cosmeticum]
MERPVEVVVSELHGAADRLREAGQRLQDGLSSVDLETRELLGSGWKGDAASAFTPVWDQWHNGAGQVVRGVQTMSDLLRVAGDQYGSTDEQAAGAVAAAFPESGAGGGSGGSGAPTGSPAPSASAVQPSAFSSPLSSPASASESVGQVASGLSQAGQTAGGMVQQAVEQAVEKAVEESKATEEGRDSEKPGHEVPR